MSTLSDGSEYTVICGPERIVVPDEYEGLLHVTFHEGGSDNKVKVMLFERQIEELIKALRGTEKVA